MNPLDFLSALKNVSADQINCMIQALAGIAQRYATQQGSVIPLDMSAAGSARLPDPGNHVAVYADFNTDERGLYPTLYIAFDNSRTWLPVTAGFSADVPYQQVRLKWGGSATGQVQRLYVAYGMNVKFTRPQMRFTGALSSGQITGSVNGATVTQNYDIALIKGQRLRIHRIKGYTSKVSGGLAWYGIVEDALGTPVTRAASSDGRIALNFEDGFSIVAPKDETIRIGFGDLAATGGSPSTVSFDVRYDIEDASGVEGATGDLAPPTLPASSGGGGTGPAAGT